MEGFRRYGAAVSVVVAACLFALPQSEALPTRPATSGFQQQWPEKPALDCDFRKNDCGMTFTRASNATMFDSTGTLVFAPHNLLVNTKWDGAGPTPTNWSGPSSGTTSIVSSSIFPGEKAISQSANTERPFLSQSITLKPDTTYTLGVYFESGSVGNDTRVMWALAFTGMTGTPNADLPSTIPGWQTITFTTASDASGIIRVGIGVINTSTGNLVFSRVGLWEGTKADTEHYRASDTSGPFYGPRIGAHVYDSATATWVNGGFLPEESRTNEALWSSAVEVSPWTKNAAVTLTADQYTFVDGNVTADKADYSGAVNDRVQQTFTGLDLNTQYTFSIWAALKAGTPSADDKVMVNVFGSGLVTSVPISVGFDLTDSLQRFDTTATTNGVGGSVTIQVRADEAVTLALGGAQMEKGAIPLSHIPTASAAATRAADVTSQDVTGQLGASNTLFVEARTGLGAGVVFQIDDGTENNRYRIERNSSDEIHVIVTDGGVAQADLNLGVVADNTAFKLAARLAANDFAASLDGGAVVTDTSGTLPTVTTARYGMDTTGNQWNSTIARVTLWNRDLPDGRLIDRTAWLPDFGHLFAANDNQPFDMLEVTA